ncbi:MAG: 4Fe-4S binding protein [Candidatus Bathyarchaeota archaeon]|nr:4Fe-4S binding protein [Candidatus Bathyarchaeota archaeon]MDH5732329.1 4Fe-4S binding protein [Candidatus Bathyarchaeota archaeon]
MVEVKVDEEKCDGCGSCVDVCPVEVLEIVEEKSKVKNPDECLACRACEVQCPNTSIEIIE